MYFNHVLNENITQVNDAYATNVTYNSCALSSNIIFHNLSYHNVLFLLL